MTDAPPDISRRLGIIQCSPYYFHLCIEAGFGFPVDTIVRGVHKDDWRDNYEILLCHDSLAEVPEGQPIPYYQCQHYVGAERGRFVK